jgi:hypothetical protein
LDKKFVFKMGNVKTIPEDYEDEYERKSKPEGEWTFPNFPRRQRINKPVEPCKNNQDCDTLAHFFEFQEYKTKEWLVYLGEISLARDDADECWKKQKIKATERCAPLIKNYLELTTKKNLEMARK